MSWCNVPYSSLIPTHLWGALLCKNYVRMFMNFVAVMGSGIYSDRNLHYNRTRQNMKHILANT
jgi:hypothetical protein